MSDNSVTMFGSLIRKPSLGSSRIPRGGGMRDEPKERLRCSGCFFILVVPVRSCFPR